VHVHTHEEASADQIAMVSGGCGFVDRDIYVEYVFADISHINVQKGKLSIFGGETASNECTH